MAIFKHQLTRLWTTMAQFVELLRARETFEIFFNQKGGNAARVGVGFGFCIDHQHIGRRPIGDPKLAAIQHILVAFFVGPQTHRHNIRSGAGFRHGQRPEMFTRHQFRQVALLLRIIAPAENLVHA